jgi:hypothetical protein
VHDLCQADANCRENAGIPVDKDGPDAQGRSDRAGVLSAGAAKARQHVLCDVVSLHSTTPQHAHE